MSDLTAAHFHNEIAARKWYNAVGVDAEWLTRPDGKSNRGDFLINEKFHDIKTSSFWEALFIIDSQWQRHLLTGITCDYYVGVNGKYDGIVAYIRGYFTADQISAANVYRKGTEIKIGDRKITLDSDYRIIKYLPDQNYQAYRELVGATYPLPPVE